MINLYLSPINATFDLTHSSDLLTDTLVNKLQISNLIEASFSPRHNVLIPINLLTSFECLAIIEKDESIELTILSIDISDVW